MAASEIKPRIEYSNFYQNSLQGHSDNRYLRTGMGKINADDIKKGNYTVPENCFAVTFDYDIVKKVTVDNEEYTRIAEQTETGRFFPDVVILDMEQAVETGLSPESVQSAREKNITHFAKVTRGAIPGKFVLEAFKENDVVITGGDNNWKVVQRHPNAPADKPEYLG